MASYFEKSQVRVPDIISIAIGLLSLCGITIAPTTLAARLGIENPIAFALSGVLFLAAGGIIGWNLHKRSRDSELSRKEMNLRSTAEIEDERRRQREAEKQKNLDKKKKEKEAAKRENDLRRIRRLNFESKRLLSEIYDKGAVSMDEEPAFYHWIDLTGLVDYETTDYDKYNWFLLPYWRDLLADNPQLLEHAK